MTTIVMPHPADMPGFKNTDLDEVHSITSEYSFSPSMVSQASGMFSFAPTEPSADIMISPSWGTSGEGAQNFHDYPDTGSSHSGEAEEYIITSGHSTPRGTKMDRAHLGETAWTSAGIPASLASGSHAMTRMNSSKSSVSTLSHSSQLSNMDMRGNATAFRNGPQTTGPSGIDSCLLLDDANAVTPVFWTGSYNIGTGLDGDNAPFPLACPGPLHVVPAQMQLGPDGLPDTSSPGSWPSFTSSRTSSPGTIDETWLPTQRPLSPNSSPEMPCQSPTTTFDAHVKHEDQIIALPPPLNRRENDSARDHDLYKTASPKDDGLYHCPWEGDAACNHKPEKLKCNYDKFVDSHLKPYRCKAESCEGARFSSTACLLRHEREAHGLHGHGDKPFLCQYEGCERSVLGNGFPRQWNLRDHMKRVHNDHGSSGGSPPSVIPVIPVAKGRKRKTDNQESQIVSSRKTSQRAVLPPKEPKQPAGKPLLEQWLDHRKAVEDMLHKLDKPEDSHNIHQISEIQKHLSAMTQMTSELSPAVQVDGIQLINHIPRGSVG